MKILGKTPKEWFTGILEKVIATYIVVGLASLLVLLPYLIHHYSSVAICIFIASLFQLLIVVVLYIKAFKTKEVMRVVEKSQPRKEMGTQATQQNEVAYEHMVWRWDSKIHEAEYAPFCPEHHFQYVFKNDIVFASKSNLFDKSWMLTCPEKGCAHNLKIGRARLDEIRKAATSILKKKSEES